MSSSLGPLDWEQMPYFLAVARGGSLRAAADRLSANHGTIDRHVRALETAYGVALFKRTRSGLELTPAGNLLLPLAEEAEVLFLGARRRLEGQDQSEAGTIRFSLSPMLAFDIVGPMLTRFFESYPGIDVEVRLTDRLEDINKLETDVSLRLALEVLDDVVAQKLYPMAVGTYASQDYVDRNCPHAGPGGEGLHWIGWDGPDNNPAWLAQSAFPRARVRHSIEQGFMHLSLIRRGYGMSSLPVIYETIYPELVRLPGTEISLGRHLWLLLHSDIRKTTRVRRFIDFLATEFREIRPLMQAELA